MLSLNKTEGNDEKPNHNQDSTNIDQQNTFTQKDSNRYVNSKTPILESLNNNYVFSTKGATRLPYRSIYGQQDVRKLDQSVKPIAQIVTTDSKTADDNQNREASSPKVHSFASLLKGHEAQDETKMEYHPQQFWKMVRLLLSWKKNS